VNREQFESSVIDLWVTTRIPLSRAHLQYHTGLSRQRLNRYLDELTTEGVLECEVDDEGEMLWMIPGAERSASGPRTFAELGRGRGAGGDGRARGADRARSGRRTRDDADDAFASLGRAAALTLAGKRGELTAKKEGEKQKSLAVSAGLSLLGPLGWLYAGSLREAAIGTVLAVIAWNLLSWIPFLPSLLLAVGLPLSAVVGAVYAWQYNRKGERTPLFLGGKKDGDKE
jgi:hypothetical protein